MKSYFVLDNGEYDIDYGGSPIQYAILAVDTKDCDRVCELAEEFKIEYKNHRKDIERRIKKFKDSLIPGTVGYIYSELPEDIQLELKYWKKPEYVFYARLKRHNIKAKLYPYHELTITDT